MDQYRIDSHKLMYHVPRVHEWLQGKNIYPIYMEISPTGACNHRCVFCAKDFMGYEKKSLDIAMMKERLKEMAALGVRSIMFAGEGEPLLHEHFAEMVKYTKACGMDVAITTNGVLLGDALSSKILDQVEWIKVSINAGTKETYAKIHRAPKKDFDQVIENIAKAARRNENHHGRCVIGMQMLLLPENRHEAATLAKIAREAGAKYLVIKPYSQHHASETKIYEEISYEDSMELADLLETFNSDRFRVVFRANAMRHWDKGELGFPHCLALPFWSYVDSSGNLWGCSAYLKDDRLLYGNLYDQNFKEIWEGEKRKKAVSDVETKPIVDQCRVNCRMGEINRYLWALKVPPPHVNFI
jgi:radical SAM protein with 4Fe4S-binding SPASM domain